MGDNKVVLLDEPTAALGVAQTHEVLELIKRLRGQGLGVVLISHNLANVFEVADRITVLRLGRWVGTFDAKATTHEQLVAYMTGAVSGAAEASASASPSASASASPSGSPSGSGEHPASAARGEAP
jgi:ABC-type sugar transport system ATPase subunit